MASPDPRKATCRRQGLAALSLILLLAGVLFTPWLFGGRVLAPFDIVHEMFLPWRGDVTVPQVNNHFVSDAVTQYIPYRMFAEQSFRQDGYIGWNPLLFGGTPQFANTMGLYFDWTMQLHRLLAFWNAWHLGLYLQFVLAGVGMFIFLRSCGSTAPIALFGAVAYMTNWQFIAWVYHRWALGSFCWMPWALWAMRPWLGRTAQADLRATPGRFVLVPVFLALAFLGGTLQHAAFVVIGCICLFLGEIKDAGPQAQGAARSFGRFALWGLLAVGLAGFMFEPTVRAFLENNASGHVRGAPEYEQGWTQPLLNAVSYVFYFFPYFLGSPASLDFWKVFLNDMFNVGFFGTVPMVLAVVALFYRSVPSGAKLLIVAGLVLPLTPLVGMLYHRINLLWILGGCWAASELVTHLDFAQLRRISLRILAGLGFLLGMGFFVGTFLRGAQDRIISIVSAWVLERADISQFGFFREWLLVRTARAADWLLPTNPVLIAALAFAAISAWSLPYLKQSGIKSWICAMAVFAQTTLFWWIWTTWSPAEPDYHTPEVVEALTPYRHSRIIQKLGVIADTPFPPNTLSAFGISTAGGYDSIHPNGMNAIVSNQQDFPGAGVLLAPSGASTPRAWVPAGAHFGGTLFTNAHADPLISAVFTASVGAESKSFPVDASRRTFNNLWLDAPAGASEIRLLENWDPRWRYQINGTGPWLPVDRAQNRSMIVPLEASHERTSLHLRFFPWAGSWIGLAASACALALLVVVLFAGRKAVIVSGSPYRP